MTDPEIIDSMIADLEAMLVRLREYASATDSVHKISLKDAAFLAGISESQMRKRCEDNRYDVDPSGFGLKRGNLWDVAIVPFLATLSLGALNRVVKWARRA